MTTRFSMIEEKSRFNDLYSNCGDFAKKLEITDPKVQAVKIEHEAFELSGSPYDIVEYADVLITLLLGASVAGFTASEILSAAEEKMATNWARDWYQKEDGTWQHK